ncbi:MAG: MerR family transcriptional regulator [Ramlibacter sp.]
MNRDAPPGAPPGAPLKSIAEVERDTGLPRATIRIWERRYGFPAPQRDDRGERAYPAEQVVQLNLMRRLVEQGHRPAKLLAGGAAEIHRLAGEGAQAQAQAQASPRPRSANQLLKLLRNHDAAAVRQDLEARLKRAGVARFAGAEVPAMNHVVGEAWGAGELEVHEEHLYSDCVSQVIRGAIARLDGALRPEAPRVLLTTLPQEHHGLGLLMAQALFALQGCPTVSLGVRLPIEQVVAGARAHRSDLVGLSFTAGVNPAHVLRDLEELRGLLPIGVRLWAGGGSPALRRRAIPGVRAVRDVLEIPDLLAEEFALPPVAMSA